MKVITFDLPIGGNCDYCNEPLEPGVYTAIDNYNLCTINGGKLAGPFVPCTECSSLLELPNVTIELLLMIHKLAAVKYKIPPAKIFIEVDGVAYE